MEIVGNIRQRSQKINKINLSLENNFFIVVYEDMQILTLSIDKMSLIQNLKYFTEQDIKLNPIAFF